MKTFICDDCQLETYRMDVGQAYVELPNSVCQDCGNDLFNGNYKPKTFVQLLSEKTPEEELLKEIFGEKHERHMRTGSSQKNIDYVLNSRKKI